jgi:hypothetical protein
MKFVHRGLEALGKTIALLTVLILVAVLVGGPVVVVLALSAIATAELAPAVGGGPLATTILGMAFLLAFCFFAGVYVAPHVPIGDAVGALLGKLVPPDHS